jgi:hypothetical protein
LWQSGQDGITALQFKRAHAVGLGQRSGVGVAELDDVAEHLIDRARVALPLTCWSAGETFQFDQQRLQLLVRLPVLAKRGALRRPARLQNGT